MVGVWDTVKATNDEDYHDAKLAKNVVAGYHAISIDERRRFFPVLRWESDARALEMWFAGVHCDVGGGYDQCGLSDIALRWMIDRAIGHGLMFKKAYVERNIAPNPICDIHDSFEGIWATLGEERRSIAPTDYVHHSVETRLNAVALYKPANLPKTPSYWRED